MDSLTHEWTVVAIKNGKFWHKHNGKDEQVVLEPATTKGYFWVFKTVSSYSPTLEEAKNWVETLAEAGRSYRRIVLS